MSRYIYTHPKEAYRDEVKALGKMFKRRNTPLLKRVFLLLMRVCVYLYRRSRYELSGKIKV